MDKSYQNFLDNVSDRIDGVNSLLESLDIVLEKAGDEIKFRKAKASFLNYLKKHNPKKAKECAEDFKKLYKEAKSKTPDFQTWAKKNPQHAAMFYAGIGMSPAAVKNYATMIQIDAIKTTQKNNKKIMDEYKTKYGLNKKK